MTSEQIRKAIVAKRETAGLKVTLLDTGWVGYFAGEASRDEFAARARSQDRPVRIG